MDGQSASRGSDPGGDAASENAAHAAPAGGPPVSTTPEFFALVYGELRELAERQMSQERPGLTLQPTALVHEAYLRLLNAGSGWESPRHFFGAAAEAMRRILIERARRVSRIKHGGGKRREALEDVDAPTEDADPGALLALDEALGELRALDPVLADVVMLRYFAGLSVVQTAEVLGRSERSVKYDWAAARAWLLRRMGGVDGVSSTDGP